MESAPGQTQNHAMDRNWEFVLFSLISAAVYGLIGSVAACKYVNTGGDANKATNGWAHNMQHDGNTR
eukprot:scaffold466428_cov37-Prasinocladus_malaysianus.AAC.1